MIKSAFITDCKKIRNIFRNIFIDKPRLPDYIPAVFLNSYLLFFIQVGKINLPAFFTIFIICKGGGYIGLYNYKRRYGMPFHDK